VLKDVQEYHNTSTRQNKTYEALGKEHDHSDATIREINKHFSVRENLTHLHTVSEKTHILL
jgi:hypothetical protein